MYRFSHGTKFRIFRAKISIAQNLVEVNVLTMAKKKEFCGSDKGASEKYHYLELRYWYFSETPSELDGSQKLESEISSSTNTVGDTQN